MDMGSKIMKMGEHIEEIIKMTRNMDMVFIHGQMEKYMMATGKKESSMVKQDLQILKEKVKLEFG